MRTRFDIALGRPVVVRVEHDQVVVDPGVIKLLGARRFTDEYGVVHFVNRNGDSFSTEAMWDIAYMHGIDVQDELEKFLNA